MAKMNAAEVRALVRECERMAGVRDASGHRKARIWRETVDRTTGRVTRDPMALLSPLMLAMNRLYTGAGLALTRRCEPATLRSEKPSKGASG
jgi:hypothetical protein